MEDIKEKEIKRNSSLELLRIIAMFMIIVFHYSLHGGFETFTFNKFNFNMYLVQTMQFWGKIGCYIFMIITGYFLINGKPKFRKVFRLILEMWFYQVVIFFVFKYIMGAKFTWVDAVYSFTPFIYGNWFVVNYIIVYMLSPYINKLLHSLDKDECKKMLITILLFYSIIPTICYYIKLPEGIYGNFDFMLVSYIFGAYIKLYGIKRFESKKYCKKTILVSIIATFLIVGILDLLAIKMKNNLFIDMTRAIGYEINIFIILTSVALFYLFNSREYESKVINFISKSMVGIYLIHDSMYVKEWLWKGFYRNNYYLYSDVLIIQFVQKVLVVFVFCLIVDIIRRFFLEKPLSKPIDFFADKVELLFKKLGSKAEKYLE